MSLVSGLMYGFYVTSSQCTPVNPPRSAPACSVSWQEVWQFYVSELGLVAHLRLALDDDRPAVLSAAAAALAAVVRRGRELCPVQCRSGWVGNLHQWPP